MSHIRRTVTAVVFALILAGSMLALSAPASADSGGVSWENAPQPPIGPLGVSWE